MLAILIDGNDLTIPARLRMGTEKMLKGKEVPGEAFGDGDSTIDLEVFDTPLDALSIDQVAKLTVTVQRLSFRLTKRLQTLRGMEVPTVSDPDKSELTANTPNDVTHQE